MPSQKPGYMRLVFRQHDLGGTDYDTIAVLEDHVVREMQDELAKHPGPISYLYGAPDWERRATEADIIRLETEKSQLQQRINDLLGMSK